MSNQHQTASLGCGTLILIAIIVLFFSRGVDNDLKEKISEIDAKLTLIIDRLDVLAPEDGITNALPKDNILKVD